MGEVMRTTEVQLERLTAEMERLRSIAHTFQTPEEKQALMAKYKACEDNHRQLTNDMMAYQGVRQHLSDIKHSIKRGETIREAAAATRSIAGLLPPNNDDVIAEFRANKEQLKRTKEHSLVPGGPIYGSPTNAEIDKEFEAMFGVGQGAGVALPSPYAIPSSLPAPSPVYGVQLPRGVDIPVPQ